jgi:hypothetical protein
LWQIAPLAAYPVTDGRPLLPPMAAGGYLFLGLSGVEPPEVLSLLFLIEAVAAPELSLLGDPRFQVPVWSCLEGDRWNESLGACSVHDGTAGFRQSGIVRIELPTGADAIHTIMPTGYVWLRVQVQDPAKHLRTLQVLPHAAAVAWVPPPNPAPAEMAAHFAQPLPAGSITALQTPNPAIQQVVQPLPGCGGAPAETDEDFATRVSERLRHKGRAVAVPDYERLLLQRFPEVFSARTLAPESAQDAGSITVVVLPTVKTVPASPPPGFLFGDLLAMAQCLQSLAPLSAHVDVLNPDYDPIQIRVQVRFRNDHSFAFYAAQLTEALKAFISPWIYSQATVVDPVTSFHVSDFSAFIRQTGYVLEVGVCGVFPVNNGKAGAPFTDWVKPSSRRAMLVSTPTHQITDLA